jgi:sugar phosphate isomerase/epimerase
MLYDPSHLHLQQMDYLAYIDIYHRVFKAFHVKDAEFRATGAAASTAAIRTGSTAPGVSVRWATARSISKMFSKLTQYDFDGWAVLEWECCLKDARPARAKAVSLSAAYHPRFRTGV